MKALHLLKTSPSLEERATSYVTSIKRDIQREVIDTLLAQKDKIKDQIDALSTINIDTDVNKGVKAATREECKEVFKQLIELEFQLTIVELELKCKTESFTKYFVDGKEKSS